MRRTSIVAVTAGVVCCLSLEARGDDLYVYPNKGQSETQQEQDKFECHQWATKETGVDPVALAEQTPGAQQGSDKSGVAPGAARGAGLGAIRGGISGDAGAGAMHGAGVGGMIAVVRSRRALKEQKSADAKQDSELKDKLDKYDRAYGACLSGRGYTVK